MGGLSALFGSGSGQSLDLSSASSAKGGTASGSTIFSGGISVGGLTLGSAGIMIFGVIALVGILVFLKK